VKFVPKAEPFTKYHFYGIFCFMKLPAPKEIPNWSEVEALKALPAQDFLNAHIGSILLESAAAFSHESWRGIKTAARDDPTNTYLGWGPQRIKVRQLSDAEKVGLGIPIDADPAADVYHPLDLPFDQLDEDTKNKNTVPMLVLADAMAEIVLSSAASISELETKLIDFIERRSPELVLLLNKIHHIAFLAGEIRSGERPYGENARDDFRLFDKLDGATQELDYDTLLPVAEFLLRKIHGDPALAKVLRGAEMAEAIFNSERKQNIRYPLEGGILHIAQLHASLPYDQRNSLNSSSFISEAINCGFHDWDINSVDNPASENEAFEVVDELETAGFLEQQKDGTWHITPAGEERLKQLRVLQRQKMEREFGDSFWERAEEHAK
jgi:hypothetical protein